MSLIVPLSSTVPVSPAVSVFPLVPVSTTIKSPTSSSSRDLFLLGRLVRLALTWEDGSRSVLLLRQRQQTSLICCRGKSLYLPFSPNAEAFFHHYLGHLLVQRLFRLTSWQLRVRRRSRATTCSPPSHLEVAILPSRHVLMCWKKPLKSRCFRRMRG